VTLGLGRAVGKLSCKHKQKHNLQQQQEEEAKEDIIGHLATFSTRVAENKDENSRSHCILMHQILTTKHTDRM